MSYAPDFVEQNRRLATNVDRILKGANPGELPIEQSTEIKLVVNLKTARALGITFPPAILIQATEFIERGGGELLDPGCGFCCAS